ncbi:MAG: EipA family protein [Alphaproteobacteria bacterium]|nr:EipA family protein [Alphaproteobacteria bacterium]
MDRMKHFCAVILIALAVLFSLQGAVPAQPLEGPTPPQNPENTYTIEEIIAVGDRFLGDLSQGLAQVVQKLFSRFGSPNGYVVGNEGGFAFIGGLRYGQGELYTRNVGNYDIFWQGPSIGWDFGAAALKTMFLVYNLQNVDQMYRYYAGAEGNATLIGGISVQVLSNDNVIIVPIRVGVGARVGLNVGYVKFTPTQTWNPF